MGFITSILVSGTGLGSMLDTAPSAPPIIMAAPAASPAIAACFMEPTLETLKGTNAESSIVFQRLALHFQRQPAFLVGILLGADFNQFRRQFREGRRIARIK